MNPRRKKRLAWALSIIIGAGAAISLILYALSQQVDFFYTPSEMVASSETKKPLPTVGQRLRIGGMVVEGSVKRDPETLRVEFKVTDNGAEQVTIFYQGILPDLFREGQGIVAQGTLSAPMTLNASEVLAKHDEEYMPPDLAEQMKGIKHQNPNQSDYKGSGQ